MTDTAKKRLAIDLDEIERQLRQSAPQPAQPKSDPLAELARIVGQDDPFRAILSADRAGVEPRRHAPEVDDIFALGPDTPERQPASAYPDAPQQHPQAYRDESFAQDHGYGEPAHAAHHPHADRPSFDAFLDEAGQSHAAPASPPQGYAYEPGYADHQAYAEPAPSAQDWRQPAAYSEPAAFGDLHDDSAYDEPRNLRNRPAPNRKAIFTVAAVLGVAVLGVGSALYFSDGGSGATDGEPPLITAGSDPIKIAPQNPGGVEIPNQNKQIFEGARDEETQIVDREEQPVDIEQVARDAPRVVLPPPATAPDRQDADPINQMLAGNLDPAQALQPPAATSSAVAALGEPRRVRTVSVRPDGTIIAREPSPPVQVAEAAPAQPQAITDLIPLEQPAPSTPEPQVQADAPVEQAPATVSALPEPAAQPEPAETPDAAEPPAATEAPAAPLSLTGAIPAPPPPDRGSQQVAAIAPPAPAEPAPAQATAPVQSGGYAVQLAIRDSEERAYQAFTQYQTRYADIIGNVDPIVRRAEVNGNVIYRIRVGPYALSDANGVCAQIKSAGGDCFVARN